MKPGFIYILTNKTHTVLYVGVTSNLPQRILDHKEKRYANSFSKRYNVDQLVFWEFFQEIGDAIMREKQIKGGSRQKKLDLINALNPEWNDLYEDIRDIMNPFT
ncbi:GIY-YIG nuclease family protein [Kaistella carnis]|uniref:GIY-YIG nuclease family protein n=1 Tax=Kaistella carnis TaxID=1241979 RepID=A0A3G8XLM4_9FLAO|nr:GIY-YIG nuclease family protein [Kaistella carnis]AZI34112.1 GIY-YIG nuclease family protein [Kaistella carnis]